MESKTPRKSPGKFSDFSSRPWRNLPPIWAIHMATRRPVHMKPIRMDFLYGFSLKRHQVHVDRHVVGSSAGRHVDHPRGGQISPWPARKVTARKEDFSELAKQVGKPTQTQQV